MNGLFTLLVLSALMAVASFLAGMLPLSVSLSTVQLQLISTVGMGVLVGTSLVVIIPEGVETLYRSNDIDHEQGKRMVGRMIGEVRWEHSSPARLQSVPRMARDAIPALEDEVFALPGPVIPDTLQNPPKAPTGPNEVGILGDEERQETGTEHDGEEEIHHAWIGVALISGFILMFLIDKLPQLASKPQARAKTHNIALNHIGRRFNLISSPVQDEDESEGFIENAPVNENERRGFATTVGLVIHAMADGIALGASSSASHTSLSLVIFFAIMIHKAPAAFGLTSVLLRQGLSKRVVRAHLVLFSLAAPTGALLTWIAARILGASTENKHADTKWWTGVLLLFSAGTFLYVAMHSMQEVLDGQQSKHEMNGHVHGSLERRDSNAEPPNDHKISIMDIGAAVFGMILPLFLQIRHVH